MKPDYRNKSADAEYESLVNSPHNAPISFTYGDVTYDGLPESVFTLTDTVRTRDDDSEECEFVFHDGRCLSVRLRVRHYFSHGSTELTAFFENVGDENSEIISNIRFIRRFCGRYPMLKGILGDHVNQYRPYCIDLADNLTVLTSDTGRATHINFPYFNLEYGDGGALLAIGWAGGNSLKMADLTL